MKRIIKLSLTVLVMLSAFLSNPQKIQRLTVEAAEEIIDNDLVSEEVILKVKVYLSEYFEEFPVDDLGIEKIELEEYLFNKLKADHFTEDEIIRAFQQIEKDRVEEVIYLAESYLDEEPSLSRNALVSKFKEELYSQKEIEQGLEVIDIDWKEQAVIASEEYINTKVEIEEESYSIISRKCLYLFLIKEKDFRLEEATYGIEKTTIDWKEQAVKQAKDYLAADAYSKIGLIKKLIADEFTKEEAEYGVSETQTNWKKQAMKKAEEYFAHSLLQSKDDLIIFLRREGFTEEEINYTVDSVFNDVEVDSEVEEPSINVPVVSAPERPIIIRPVESITSHVVISAQGATNKQTKLKDPTVNKSSLTTAKRRQSSKKDRHKIVGDKATEDTEDSENKSLFDIPVFIPVILVLVVGNLYLFQKS